MPPAFNLSQDQTLQLNIVAQTRPKPLLDSHQKKPIRLTYPCFRRRRNRPVYTLEPKFKRARGGKTSDKALHSLVFIPNINIWGFHLHKNVKAYKCDLAANLFDNQYPVKGPICFGLWRLTFSWWTQLFTCQRGDGDRIKRSFVVATGLGGGEEYRPHHFVVKL